MHVCAAINLAARATEIAKSISVLLLESVFGRLAATPPSTVIYKETDLTVVLAGSHAPGATWW